MDVNFYVLKDIILYCDIDTKFVLKNVCKQFANIKIILKNMTEFMTVFEGATNGSMRMTKYKCIDEDQNVNYGTPIKTYKNISSYAKEYGVTKWDIGLNCACMGGNKDVIEFMINKGVTNWDSGLYGACRSDDTEIVDMMIHKGAKMLLNGFKIACFYGQLNVVKLFFTKGIADVNIGISFAQRGKEYFHEHKKRCGDVIDFLIQTCTLMDKNENVMI